MMNFTIIILLSLASHVACGGGGHPPFADGAMVFSDDEPSELLNEDKPITEDDEFHDTVMTHEIKSDFEDVQANVTDELANNDDNRAPLTLAGEPSEPPNEEKPIKEAVPISEDTVDAFQDTVIPPISEETDDAFHDVIMTHSSGGIEDVQDNYIVEQQAPKSPEQESVESRYVSGSGTFNCSDNRGIQHNIFGDNSFQSYSFGGEDQGSFQSSYVSNDGVTSTFNCSGNTGVQHNSISGKPIVFQGETLLIGGKKILGVNATLRPIVLRWGNYELYANGKRQPALHGINGGGTMIL